MKENNNSMTTKEKEEEIIKKVLSIPLEDWHNFYIIYNRMRIELFYTGNGTSPYIVINESITIYSKDLWQIYNPLSETKSQRDNDRREEAITYILKNF